MRPGRSSSVHPLRRARKAALTAVALTLGMLPLMGGVAQAAPPTGSFLNPSTALTGPGNVVSDKADGTDGTYHVVVRTTDPDAGGSIASVVIQIEDGDLDATFETIGTATRVGTTDTWQLDFDVSAHTPAGDVDADPGMIRAVVTDSNAEVTNIDQTVVFLDATAETVEITSPANGAILGFFDNDGAGGNTPTGSITGTASAGTTSVNLFFTTSPTGTVPAYAACGTAPATGATTKTFAGVCDIGATTPTAVTAVAAIPANGVPGTQSGDAHRVISPFAQTLSTFTITPSSDNQSLGFCNTYSVQARDQVGGAITNAQVDVRAVGNAVTNIQDDLQFATNAAPEGDASDPFTAADTGFASEPAAACDTVAEPDGSPDDADSDATATQGEIDNPAGPDIKGIEGSTQATGNFRFSIDAETAGTYNLSAFVDFDGDDVNDAGEFAATATKVFAAAAATTLTATPASATNVVGETHTVTATLRDQNTNPLSGQALQFRVTAGPHADNELDANPATPPGVFGPCTTAVTGVCADSYVGTEAGTDTITVFIDTNNNFTADAGELATTVSKEWVATTAATCIDLEPDTDTNPTTTTHVITAFVTNGTYDTAGDNDLNDDGSADPNDCNGTPLAGVPVDFAISDDTPDASLVPNNNGTANTERVFTNAAGVATITLDNVVADPASAGAEGQNTVTATIPGGATASSYSLNEIPLNFEDISVTGTQMAVVSACDDCTQDLTIPFPFSFYDVADTAVEVSSNGFINFDAAADQNGCCSGQPFPSVSAPQGGIVGGYFTDLDPSDGGDIYTELRGTAPNRRLIVQYENVENFSGTAANQATFQIKLFETTNRIEVHYFLVEASEGGGADLASAGVENQAGTVGTQFFGPTLGMDLANRAVLYTPGQTSVSKTWERAGLAEKIDCTPEDDRNVVGATHTVTCTVTDFFDDPIAGANVDFRVIFGPHADNDLDSNPLTPVGYFGQGTTAANGQASATYTGVDVTPNNGNDVIDGFIDANANSVDDGDPVETGDANANAVVDAEDQSDSGEVSDFVDKSWTTTAVLAGANVELDMAPTGTGTDDTPPGATNTKKCDADLASGFPLPPGGGGPTFQSSHTGTVNTVELVCVSAKDANGNILIGSTATLTSTGVGTVTDATGPPPAAATQTATIDADGFAEFYIFSTATGTQTVTASIAGVTDTDTGTKTYTPALARQVTLTHIGPSANPPGTSHQVRARVVDRFGNTVAGQVLTFTESGAGRFQTGPSTDPSSITVVTGSNGEVIVEVFTAANESGLQQITAALPTTPGPLNDDCELAVGQSLPGADPNATVAGRCSQTVTKLWSSTATAAPGTFFPVTPARVFDSRNGTGTAMGKVGPGTPNQRVVDVTGTGGVPASGATAVVVNLTITEGSANTYLSVTPNGGNATSSLNVVAGETRANLVKVAVGSDGNIRLFNAVGNADVVMDVFGYYSDSLTGGSRFNPLTPARITDTRTGSGATGKLGAGTANERTVDVTGVGGVPATGVTAVVVNTTVTEGTAPSFLAVTPSGFTGTSNLNFGGNQDVPNLVVVQVGADGNVRVNNGAGQVHFIFDVVGWYGAAGAATGDLFTPVDPQRILDTRTGVGTFTPAGKLGAGAANQKTVKVTGVGGVPATGVTSVVVNLTGTEGTANTFLSVTPGGGGTTSNLNLPGNQDKAVLVVVPVDATGSVKVFNAVGQIHVLFDVVGYFGS